MTKAFQINFQLNKSQVKICDLEEMTFLINIEGKFLCCSGAKTRLPIKCNLPIMPLFHTSRQGGSLSTVEPIGLIWNISQKHSQIRRGSSPVTDLSAAFQVLSSS